MCQSREHPKAMVVAGPIVISLVPSTVWFKIVSNRTIFLYSEGKILIKIGQGTLLCIK